MMRRLIFMMMIGVLCNTYVWAQDTLRLVVQDRENRLPVWPAFINIYGQDGKLTTSTQTNEDGKATIVQNAYPVTIEVAMQGYEPFKKTWQQAPDNRTIKAVLTKKFSSLDEVVVTGLSQPVKMKNALSVYQVIPRSQIQALGAVSLGDALRNQLNVTVGDAGILGSNIRMQGMSGDKVKILVDGMPVNGREFGNINLTQINMNNVERIELIQGPMSVVYGTDAIGGVINVITRKENKKIGARINTYAESIGKYNGDASVTYKLKERHQLSAGGGRNFFGGYKSIDRPLHYNGDTIHTSRAFFFKPYEQYLANVAYSYTAPSQFRLMFASDFMNEKVTNKGSLQTWDPWKAYAIDEYYHTTRSLNRLMAEGKVGKTGRWQSQNSYAHYYRIRNRVEQNMVTMERIPTNGTGDQDTSRFQTYTFRGNYINQYKLLQYNVGYDINLDYARSLKVSGYDKEIQDYAVYTNLTYPLVKDKLTAQGGLRALYNTAYKAPVIPSVNLLYTPSKVMQVRGSYSRGFRAPSLKEMYLSFIDQNHYIVGNPDIKAENSNHLQVSASYQAYERKADYVQFMITGFYNAVNNGITLVNINPHDTNSISYRYHNITRQTNAIGTAQMDAQWRNFHLQLGYSYNYTFEEKGVYNAFDVMEANANLQYYWQKTGLNINLFYKLTGAQPFIQNNIDGTATYNGTQQSLNMLDGSLEKKLFNNKLQVIAGVKNILNVTRRNVSGLSSTSTGSVHGTSGTGFLMPRSVYTSLHFIID
jgi:outer membrane receptor for ferrienterochelin and colicins